jgi:hypothetical protein
MKTTRLNVLLFNVVNEHFDWTGSIHVTDAALRVALHRLRRRFVFLLNLVVNHNLQSRA